MINIGVNYAIQWKFDFSADKCSVMVATLNSHSSDVDYVWTINGEVLRQSKSATHVGIPETNDMKCHEKVKLACRKRQSCPLPVNRHINASARFPKLNPLTLTMLYKYVVIPSAQYGCEI